MPTVTLSPVLKQRFVGNNGAPLVGGKVFSYFAGTSTPTTTYSDAAGSVPNANPVILDFRGEASIYIEPNKGYKFVLAPSNDTDPPTNPIWTVDNVRDNELLTLYGGVDVGISNQYILNFTASFSSYTDGIIIYWIPSNTNTGPSTINVNGLGPVSIINQDGSALAAGQIQANQVAQILFKGTGFLLLSSLTVISTGTFPITFNIGFTAPVMGTLNFTRFGNEVTLVATVNITGTSNSTAMAASAAIPIGLRPPNFGNRSALCSSVLDNGIPDKLARIDVNSAGDLTFFLFTGSSFDLSGFTASGTKGLITGWQASYSL